MTATSSRESFTATRRVGTVARALRWLSPRLWCLEDEAPQLAALAPVGGTCIDIGAEFGLYTVLFAEAVGADGRVVAVEANPALARRLRRLMAALGPGHVDVVAAAIVADDGADRVRLSIPYRGGVPVWGRAYVLDGASHPGPNSEFSKRREVTVPAVTLDRVTALLDLDHVDLVKSDVEGAELAMLIGGTDVLEHHRPIWMLELEDRHLDKYGASISAVTERFAAASYNMYRLIDHHWQRCDRLGGGRNYVFAPEEHALFLAMHAPASSASSLPTV
ncbi:FkbM family methyltransferase [Dietzia kunjamensis]|uniref:FkbM family methyltransferase n=1 Tax=Dietzia kunjamensis TaxID=322509 RepID=UPI0022B38792|nr:FkbM family methyltransferase [Dietzia kunjamensis]MCZ4657391.1 FkbM family methyltransferase [Dietzia kunjamensis]